MMKLKHSWLTICLLSLSLYLGCSPDMTTDVPTDDCDLSNITHSPASVSVSIPDYFPSFPNNPSNQLTKEGVDLGRFLFYDPILSGDSTMACASCHKQEHAFTELKATSIGIDGIAGSRSSMSLVNLAFIRNGLFWDGRSNTLEEQALLPVEDPIELHANWNDVEQKLRDSDFYKEKFRKAFEITNCDEITKELAVKAIAQFESILISKDSKYDQVKRGDAFFTDEEARGFDMYFDISPNIKDAECAHCHNEPFFTSNDFFNNGIDSVGNLNDFLDLGRGKVTNFEIDNGKFKAPSLRNVMLTAPYMHDGRFETIEDVVNHYSSGGKYSLNKDPLIYSTNFTEQEMTDLISFLNTLTDTVFISNPEYANPW